LSGFESRDFQDEGFGSAGESTIRAPMHTTQPVGMTEKVEAAFRDSVAVRYYLRVVVQDGFDKTCWNTMEIFLYRGEHPLTGLYALPTERTV
jgi:hypothetical protein